jgi:hypothetical protein
LPRLHNDLVELTTDETAATLAMPMATLKKGHAVSATPPLAPRLDSATASIGNAGALSVASGGRPPAGLAPSAETSVDRRGPPRSPHPAVGPGGTQPVVVGRALDHLPKGDAEPLRPGNLPPHPAGYYLSPAVQASLARAHDDDVARDKEARAVGRGASELAPSQPPSDKLPHAYDDSSSSSPGDGEVRTQVYRPDETGRRHGAEPSSDRTAAKSSPPADQSGGHSAIPGSKPRAHPIEPASLVRPNRNVSLVLVLIGFVVVGFVAVAAVMKLFIH